MSYSTLEYRYSIENKVWSPFFHFFSISSQNQTFGCGEEHQSASVITHFFGVQMQFICLCNRFQWNLLAFDIIICRVCETVATSFQVSLSQLPPFANKINGGRREKAWVWGWNCGWVKMLLPWELRKVARGNTNRLWNVSVWPFKWKLLSTVHYHVQGGSINVFLCGWNPSVFPF